MADQVLGNGQGTLTDPISFCWAALCEVGRHDIIEFINVNKVGHPCWRGPQPAPEEVHEAFRLWHKAMNPDHVRCLKVAPFTPEDIGVMAACFGCNGNGCP